MYDAVSKTPTSCVLFRKTHGGISIMFDVELDEWTVIHAVDVIRRGDEYLIRTTLFDVSKVLKNRISSSFVPVGPVQTAIGW
jgi:hypothetical protein